MEEGRQQDVSQGTWRNNCGTDDFYRSVHKKREDAGEPSWEEEMIVGKEVVEWRGTKKWRSKNQQQSGFGNEP